MIKSLNSKIFKRFLQTNTVPPSGYRKSTDDDLLWLKHDNMKSRNFLYSQKTLKRDYFIQNDSHYHWSRDIKGIVNFGNTCEGQPGFVHGGASAAVLDEVLGFTCFANKFLASTSNLNINYYKPIKLNNLIFVKSRIYNINNRDIYLNASLFQNKETGEQKKLVEAYSIWKLPINIK
uniref:Acyl-coenzyme A thioesterase THEM4 n=1 Tax=viral metagenome TaxID=1070528 RepID=A0A6C0C549_9ZZZZ